jgi:hypothetical protein
MIVYICLHKYVFVDDKVGNRSISI